MALPERVIGIEVEYGINGEPYEVVANYRSDEAIHRNSSDPDRSIIDSNDRGPRERDHGGRAGWGWTAGCDTMLANGARFYIDMGHPEYSAPESLGPLDALLSDKAGEIVLDFASGHGEIAQIFKDNTDRRGNAYGTHENYFLKRMSKKKFRGLARFTTPFFVTRPIISGSGKVTFDYRSDPRTDFALRTMIRELSELEGKASATPDAYQKAMIALTSLQEGLCKGDYRFELSQRASFFKELIGLQTTYDRPIINTRDEPLAGDQFFRFHVINGDANMSEYAGFLKLGTAGLVMDLFEEGLTKDIELGNPIKTFHEVSRDLTFQKKYEISVGGEEDPLTAVDIQRVYLDLAENNYRGRDDLTNQVLDLWDETLNMIEAGADSAILSRRLDWNIKKALIDDTMLARNCGIDDERIRNLDIKYHQVGEKGIFNMMQSQGHVDRMLTDEQIVGRVFNPPENTRAWARGQLIKRGIVNKCDWHRMLVGESDTQLVFRNPLKGTRTELEAVFTGNPDNINLIKQLGLRGYN
jgi:Pup amidohydrolase